MAIGRLVRFDEARGYGFITPQSGGSDVFMHANEFLSGKHLLRPGTLVEFDTSQGERGLRATAVRGVDEPQVPAQTRAVRPEECEPLLTNDFLREVTDVIIERAPTATGQEIAQLRQGLAEVARSHGWVLD